MAWLRVAPFGLSGMAMGALALVVAMTVLVAGPFAPQQPVGVSIGEIAGDIITSTWREMRGKPQPVPVPQGMDIDEMLKIAAIVLGAVALVAGVASRLRREPRVAGRAAIWMGAGALAFQLFTWTVLVILGMFLLVEIIRNISGLASAAESGGVEAAGGAGSGGGDGGWLEGLGEFFGGLFDWLPGFGN